MTRAIAWFAVLAFGASALAEVPKNARPENDTLQAVLDRIHTHAASDAWQKEGWKDDAIDAYVEKLVATIAAATGNANLKPPVKLTDVRPLDPLQRVRLPQEGLLIVGRDLKLTHSIRRSIILADGSVELRTIPEECVIVARHAILGRSNIRKCVLIAGNHFAGQFDGEPGNASAGSVIVSRGTASLRASYGSLMAAGEAIRTGMCQNTTFLNSEIQGNDRGGSQSVRAPALTLTAFAPHSLATKIQVLGVLMSPREPPGGPEVPGQLRRPGFEPALAEELGLVFQLDGRRLVATAGEPITDERGQPAESLSGWTLSFISDQVAIFRNGESEAVVRTSSK